MERLGVIDMIELVAVLIFALPLGILGGSRLIHGDSFGVVYIGIAGIMIIVEHSITTHEEIPGDVLEKIAEIVVIEPDEEDTNQGPLQPVVRERWLIAGWSEKRISKTKNILFGCRYFLREWRPVK